VASAHVRLAVGIKNGGAGELGVWVNGTKKGKSVLANHMHLRAPDMSRMYWAADLYRDQWDRTWSRCEAKKHTPFQRCSFFPIPAVYCRRNLESDAVSRLHARFARFTRCGLSPQSSPELHWNVR